MTVAANPEYAAYLAGPYWQKKRQERFEHDGRKCVRCGASECLEVHHITYERLGRERLTDLLTLCSDCHRRDHGRDPSLPGEYPAAAAFEAAMQRGIERDRLEDEQQAILDAVLREVG